MNTRLGLLLMEDVFGVFGRWADPSLTWSLIAAIEENITIKRGLYPPPGGNPSTANGGGKAKTDHYAELAKLLFTHHEKSGAAFAPALADVKLMAQWGTKIKNRVKQYVICDHRL